jgi:hypothetical protein
VGGLQIAAAVKAQHRTRVRLGNGAHHAFLWMSTLGRPLGLHLFLQAGREAVIDL